jgi:regulator of sigma E protease
LEKLTLILNILTVALGLGFVIFFHELGHFLVAKWNDVKVEKFSIGFGPALAKFKRGETEYLLAAFPLGGYVKMLGESPDESAETEGDPRAYHNKSVGARMAIISAGVLMNLVLGFLCFVFVYAWGGMLVTPARVGLVVASLPAYQAGFRTGDEIVAIDGQRGVDFQNLLSSVALSGNGQLVRMEVRRVGEPSPIELAVEPRREDNSEKPTIGIDRSLDLVLSKYPYLAPPGLEGTPPGADGFRENDRIVAVGPTGEKPEPVADVFELNRLLAKYRDKPLAFVVERGEKPKRPNDRAPETVTVTVPPVHFVDFGFRLEMGPIAGIQGGSIARRAGFKIGDRIVKVDGKDDFDPMKLPDYCYDHARQPVAFEIERPLPNGKFETINISATPDATPPWTEPILGIEPLEVPGLGLAYTVVPKIVAVREGSPAAKAGLKPGDLLSSMAITGQAEEGESKSKTVTFKIVDKDDGWPHAFSLLQDPADTGFVSAPDKTVTLTVNGSQTPITLTPEPDSTWFHPLRGLRLEYLRVPLPPMSVAGAFKRAGKETASNVFMIYNMIRSLKQGRVSPKMIGGPIRIAAMAYSFVSSGLALFIYFLGMLSVNLVVLNFLPIPPLDGGQMLFLIAEKVRGRPLPESAVIAGTYAGLIFVLGLMLFVLYQDVVLTFLS